MKIRIHRYVGMQFKIWSKKEKSENLKLFIFLSPVPVLHDKIKSLRLCFCHEAEFNTDSKVPNKAQHNY